MNKLCLVIAGAFLMGGCVSLGVKNACSGRDLRRISYFDQGQYLAAFKTVLEARGSRLEGILQIKKTEENVYDVLLFAAGGGYKLMQAKVTPNETEFVFLTPAADHAVVRAKAESFLRLLLFPPSQYKKCREKDGLTRVTYSDGGSVRYEYAAGEIYPRAAVYKKTFGSARMTFGQYAAYETGEIAHYLYYRDGMAEAELTLLTLKK